MIRRKQWLKTAVSSALGVFAITACQAQPRPPTTVTITRIVVETAVPQTVFVEATAEPEETATPEPEPDPQKELVICTTQEPISLYPYARTLPIETAVSHAIYENDYTLLSFDIQPQGLTAVPSLANDDAILREVTVGAGDLVVNANGEVVLLAEGIPIINSSGELILFDGTPVNMRQLVVEFTMKQRYWADGEPVTAVDSIFSFKLEADPDTPTAKYVTSRTASYEATGNLNLRWTGLPGFWDKDYALRFWKPLPSHLWGNESAADLRVDKLVNRRPVGDGPFQVSEWLTGDYLKLEPNPHYYRSGEGLPKVESVLFKFYPDQNELFEALLAERCDIITPNDLDMSHIPLLLAAETNGLIRPYIQSGTVYEHIDFGINSWGRYGDGRGRPDWFEDLRVRQAITLCTNRQGMINEILYGRTQPIHSYIPSIHPLFPEDLQTWPYDIEAGNLLLDEAGYLDSNGDGIREDPVTHQPFRVTLGTGTFEMQQQIARIFKNNMRDCGIEILPYHLPEDEWYASGPDGPLFGRQFDLGEFAWMAKREPACDLYTSWEITGPGTETNRSTRQPFGGWDAANETGWWNQDFDTACQITKDSLPGTPPYEENHKEAQHIFAENLPVIPLFFRQKVSAVRPHIQNFVLDPTQPSALWNLFEIDILN